MLILRGTARVELRQHERAADDFARAIQLKVGDAMVWYRRALVGLGTEDSDADRHTRIRLLSLILARHPRDPRLWLERADIYGSLRRWREVVADCTRALQQSQTLTAAWIGRADARAELGHWAAAAADYAQVCRSGSAQRGSGTNGRMCFSSPATTRATGRSVPTCWPGLAPGPARIGLSGRWRRPAPACWSRTQFLIKGSCWCWRRRAWNSSRSTSDPTGTRSRPSRWPTTGRVSMIGGCDG